jgi:small subunit ribosomal protein S9
MQIINTIGRRKTSVARVYVKPGKGDIKINDRELKEYFLSEIHQTLAKQALAALKLETSYDVNCQCRRGWNYRSGGSR